MTARMGQQFPAVMEALRALGRASQAAAEEAGIERTLIELVRIRVSQINRCAYCLRLHTRDALLAGESPDRLAVLPAWRETRYFSEMERDCLALAEATVTLASRAPVAAHYPALSAAQHAAVRWLAVAVGALNQVAVTSDYDVQP